MLYGMEYLWHRGRKIMTSSFVNGLIAGAVAGVIWMGITLWVGWELTTIGWTTLAVLVVGVVGTSIISSIVTRAQSGPGRAP